MASSGQWPGGQRDGPGGPSSTAWASVSEAQLPSPRSSPWRNHLRPTRLVLPVAIQSWSLTSLESCLTGNLFRQILQRIERLAWHQT